MRCSRSTTSLIECCGSTRQTDGGPDPGEVVDARRRRVPRTSTPPNITAANPASTYVRVWFDEPVNASERVAWAPATVITVLSSHPDPRTVSRCWPGFVPTGMVMLPGEVAPTVARHRADLSAVEQDAQRLAGNAPGAAEGHLVAHLDVRLVDDDVAVGRVLRRGDDRVGRDRRRGGNGRRRRRLVGRRGRAGGRSVGSAKAEHVVEEDVPCHPDVRDRSSRVRFWTLVSWPCSEVTVFADSSWTWAPPIVTSTGSKRSMN